MSCLPHLLSLPGTEMALLWEYLCSALVVNWGSASPPLICFSSVNFNSEYSVWQGAVYRCSVFWLLFSYSDPYAFLQKEKLLLLSIKSLLVVYPLDSFSEVLIEVTASGSFQTFSESHWLWGPSSVSGISLHFMLQSFWLWSLTNITSLLTSSPHLLVGAGE